jgi:hypothetical protein
MSRQLAAELKDIGSGEEQPVMARVDWPTPIGRARRNDRKVYDFGSRIVQDESNCKPVRPIRRSLRKQFAATAAAKAAAKEKLRSGHRGAV